NTKGAFGADGVGFDLHSTIGEVLTGNVAMNNIWGGFLLQASTGNLLRSNTATGSTVPGILLAIGAGFGFLGADRNTMISNVAYGNQAGFAVTTSSLYNRFTSNIAHNNGAGFDVTLASDLNVFDRNQVY